jgi:putative transposase
LFATLERELLNRRNFRTQAEAKMAIFEWLEGWYNSSSYCLTSLCH